MRSKPIDIEKALADAFGWVPLPLPPKFAAPLVHVRSNGGSKPTPVTDRFAIAAQCYGSTWEEANDLCRDAVAKLLDLEGRTVGDAVVLDVDLGVLPYVNPDPSRPELPRVAAQAYITCKSITK